MIGTFVKLVKDSFNNVTANIPKEIVKAVTKEIKKK